MPLALGAWSLNDWPTREVFRVCALAIALYHAIELWGQNPRFKPCLCTLLANEIWRGTPVEAFWGAGALDLLFKKSNTQKKSRLAHLRLYFIIVGCDDWIWAAILPHLNLLCAKSPQSCPTVCDPMDCMPPGSSVHGILQARILEWGCHFLPQGILPMQGSNPCRLRFLHWQAGSLPLAPPGKPLWTLVFLCIEWVIMRIK